MTWLATSIVLSIVLTVLLNGLIRLFPGPSRRSAERLDDWVSRPTPPPADDGSPQVRVIVPWKAMLIASIVLTLGLNLLIRIF